MTQPSQEGQVSPARRAHAAPSPVIGSRLGPICLKNPLEGKLTACSAACRRKRSRQWEAERPQRRDQEVLALPDHAGRLKARAGRAQGPGL